MAHMTVDGLGPLIDDLSELAALPDDVVADMLNAGADVLVQAQQKEVQQQWNGPYSMGISSESIQKDRKIRTTKYIGVTGHSINVYPQGERKRGGKSVRNAEIAFINEYGAPKRGIAARPAIFTANEKAADEAVEAGERVYHAYLDSKNL